MRKIILAILILLLIGTTVRESAAKTYVDETVSVPAGMYRYYSFATTDDNVRVTVDVEVLSGNDIDVHIVDEDNFALLAAGDSFYAYLNKQRVGEFSEEVTLGEEGRYYVVLSNTYSLLSSKSVHIVIDAKPSQQTELFLILIGLAILGAIIVGGFLLWKRSQRSKVATQPSYQQPGYQQPPAQPIYQQPPTATSQFCTGCGQPLKPGSRFCENCGQEHT